MVSGLPKKTPIFSRSLRHETSLQTDVGVTHLAFDFCARHECRNGVDDDEVDGPRTHEHVGDFEGLFTRVGLRDEKLVDVDTERLGVFGVESVFRVDERGDAATRLNVGDGVKCEGRLTR